MWIDLADLHHVQQERCAFRYTPISAEYNLPRREIELIEFLLRLSKIVALMHGSELKPICTDADSADGIIRTDYSGPSTEGYDAFAMFILETLIVYEPDFFFEDSAEEFFIVWLFFDSMGKNHVGFLRYEQMWWYLLDSQEEVTVGEVFPYSYPLIAVFIVSIAADRAGLHCHPLAAPQSPIIHTPESLY
jgi:hypothetical protein